MASDDSIEHITAQLEAICSRASHFEAKYASGIASVHPKFRDGARNLVHYLALRHEDIRDLQEVLASLGLSSLGRAERNVVPSIRMVLQALKRMSGDADVEPYEQRSDLQLRNPDARAHKLAIFGDEQNGREVSIMVTLPTDAGSRYPLVVGMISAGMNIARINCGHDCQRVWEGMVENVRKASQATGQECKIVMDLSGPKLRTGDIAPGPQVIHVRPRRDPLGRVIAPRRLRFIPDDKLWPGKKSLVIPLPRECIDYASVGDAVRFRDTRGKKRTLEIVQKDSRGLVVETFKGAYIVTGMKFRLVRRATGEKISYRVGELPAIENPILLRAGDTLLLHSESIKGTPAILDTEGNVKVSARIPCQQPEVFGYVVAGDPVWFNDGKIGGIVQSASEEELAIKITKAKPTGSRLRSNQGINFPNSKVNLSGLTTADKVNLDFATRHADAVCLSFVRELTDITALQEQLQNYAHLQLGVIIKIETEQAFNDLPRLLLATMRSYPAAIMIARGDLAVECGWERLAELQEEILWLCEAAQLPVIWATDVLRREAKRGQPSRAEITDAAMSQRADCVMLNKGPHILATIRMLDNILRRMQNHQYKKTARLRKLSISDTTN